MVVPEDWESRPIGDFLEFKNGLNKGKEYFGHGTPIVNYMDVYHHRGLHCADIGGCVSVDAAEIRRFAVKKNDVFFTRTSETPDEVGFSSVLLDELPDGVFSGFVLRGHPKNDELSPSYCKYCFSTAEVREEIIRTCTYTTRALTNGNLLSRIHVLVPSRTEQLRIVEVLDDVDNLIECLERIITKKRDLREGVAEVLLTGTKRLPGNNGPWFSYTVGELGSLKKGSGIRRGDSGSGVIPCIRYGEIYTTYSAYTHKLETCISNSVAMKATPIKTGDIVFACTGETKEDIGKCVAYLGKQDAYAGGDTQILTLNCKVDSLFLASLLNTSSVHGQMASYAQGDAVVHLSGESIKAISLVLPDIQEQRAIANVLVDLDDDIKATERKLGKYKQVRQGMMRELLTGHIRLAQE